MQKTYSRINWENYPSTDTPLNETNLNKIDYAVNEIDNRVIDLDTTKTDLTTAYGLVKSITLNESTGVFTITYLSGATATIDTLLEKLAINFDYDAATQELIIYLSDGTTKTVDLSELITQYEFVNSAQLNFTVTSDGKVTATVIDGSITRSKLDPDYLAEIDTDLAAAQKAASDSASSATASAQSASDSASSANASSTSATTAANLVETAERLLASIQFKLDEDGHIYYKTENDSITFRVDPDTGMLQFKIITE